MGTTALRFGIGTLAVIGFVLIVVGFVLAVALAQGIGEMIAGGFQVALLLLYYDLGWVKLTGRAFHDWSAT